MKLLAIKPSVRAVLALWLAVSLAVVTVRAGQDKPTPTPSPLATPKVKKPKHTKDTADPTLPPKIRKPKDIQFPAPIGQPSHDVTIPSYDQMGKLISIIKAAKMTAIDKDHVQMEGMNFDLNNDGGGEDYHVEMPVSIINLQTNVVASDHPVVVRTKDFELTGEKMEFNTVERSGELRGRVHMRIFNLKQAIASGQDKPAPK